MANDSREEALSVLRAILALGRRMRAERQESKITLSAMSFLGTLNRHGPMLATHLAVAERLQPQSLTRIVASLEKAGLIERHRSATDGRAITISLTKRGSTVLANDRRARLAWLESAMAAALSTDEREMLIAASAAMLKLAFHGNEEPRER